MNILLISLGFIIAFVIVACYEYKTRNLSAKPKNNVHFYVARDMDGRLYIYLGKPHRGDTKFFGDGDESFVLTSNFNSLGLNKNDYDSLKWEDEPVEVFLNLEE